MVTVAVTAIGTIASLIALWEFAVEIAVRIRRRAILTWGEAQQLLDDVVQRLEHSPFLPDIVLGVGRGGTLIAALVAMKLPGEERFVFVDTTSEKASHGRTKVSLRYPNAVPDLAGKKVLVVVGELYKGLDLDAAIDFVDAANAAEIRTLVLLAGPTSIVQPDFCGKNTKHAPLAPWRITQAGRGGRL